MGGKVKDGYVSIGAVVEDQVKSFFDKLVETKKLRSRSEAVCYALTKFMKNNGNLL